jgi:hypothetical protein
MVQVLIGMVLALLPERYRRGIGYAIGVDPLRGALVGGIIECAGCGMAFCLRYITFLQDRVGRFADQLIGQNADLAMASTGVQFGAGAVSLGEYLINPVSLLLVYFTFEGLARYASVLINGEVVPTLPLQLIAWAHYGFTTTRQSRDLGPPVEDLVQPGAGDFALCIASCRPKPWTQMTTIGYDDKLYELVREQSAQPPRKWVYLLRHRPASKIIRGAIYQYSPDEELVKVQAASAAED